MLTVPQEIKDILHQDSGYKNIRIHFPNGERSDICNDLIVRNSVSLKESLCSQNALKFGLCESPVFECETVGVGNIKGATIEVFCEIECPQTVSGAEWRTDLQKYVYSIPYGVFTVDEAKRQADMNHRKITAYGGFSEGAGRITNPYEKTKLNGNYIGSVGWSSATYTPNMFLLSMINIQQDVYSDDAFNIEDRTSDLTYSTSTSYDFWDRTYNEWTYNGHTVYLRFGYRTASISNKEYNFTKDNLLRVNATLHSDMVKAAFDEAFADWKDTYNIPDSVIEYIYSQLSRVWYVHASFTLSLQASSDLRIIPSYPFDFYPYLDNATLSVSFRNMLNYISIWDNDTASTVAIKNFTDYYFVTDISLQRMSAKLSNLNDFSISFKNMQSEYGGIILRRFVPPEDYDGIENLKKLLEYNGLFGYLTRQKAFRIIVLKRLFGLTPSGSLYPGSSVFPEGVTGGTILKGDYQTCWYDDEYTKPFGAVSCQYKNTNNEDCIFTLYLTGFNANSDANSYQVYSLENNEIIKASLWTEAQIQTICETIAANIEGVSYIPVDFTGRGLPYVEAGDTFEILTKSNDSITTIVLNRTIKGEQVLEDIYKSV